MATMDSDPALPGPAGAHDPAPGDLEEHEPIAAMVAFLLVVAGGALLGDVLGLLG